MSNTVRCPLCHKLDGECICFKHDFYKAIASLQAVLNAVRKVCTDMAEELDGQVMVDYAAGAQDVVNMILRALDGEVKPAEREG